MPSYLASVQLTHAQWCKRLARGIGQACAVGARVRGRVCAVRPAPPFPFGPFRLHGHRWLCPVSGLHGPGRVVVAGGFARSALSQHSGPAPPTFPLLPAACLLSLAGGAGVTLILATDEKVESRAPPLWVPLHLPFSIADDAPRLPWFCSGTGFLVGFPGRVSCVASGPPVCWAPTFFFCKRGTGGPRALLFGGRGYGVEPTAV